MRRRFNHFTQLQPLTVKVNQFILGIRKLIIRMALNIMQISVLGHKSNGSM